MSMLATLALAESTCDFSHTLTVSPSPARAFSETSPDRTYSQFLAKLNPKPETAIHLGSVTHRRRSPASFVCHFAAPALALEALGDGGSGRAEDVRVRAGTGGVSCEQGSEETDATAVARALSLSISF
jgi:hypothetical protein